MSREITPLEKEMIEHAKNLEFEKVDRLRKHLTQVKAQAYSAVAATSLPLPFEWQELSSWRCESGGAAPKSRPGQSGQSR